MGLDEISWHTNKEALADYERAIALDKETCALAHRGEAYQQMKRYEEAVVDLKRANELGRNVDNSLGLVFSYMGRYAEAEECYRRELSRNPDALYSLYNMAVIMVYWKGLSSAQEWLDKAHEKLASMMDTDDQAQALYGLGGLEALFGNGEQALDYLKKASAIDKRVVDWAAHDIAWRNLHNTNEFRALISQGGYRNQ